MRRWIALVLLVLLPLQAIWAAAAPYCQHEFDPAAGHIGHHQHEHADQHPDQQPDASPDGTSTGDGSGAADAHADCHVCHSGSVLTHELRAVQWGATASLPSPLSALAPPAPPGERPERPKWPALA